MRDVGVGATVREEDGDGNALGKALEQAPRVRAQPPDAVHEQLGAVERAGSAAASASSPS